MPHLGKQISAVVHRTRIDTEALIIGYTMSREDTRYLVARRLSSWKKAFDEAGNALSRPSASFKNLREEFDPLHGNTRKGWHKRPMRPDRLQVYLDLHELSSPALFALVDRILARDNDSVEEIVDVIHEPPARRTVANTEKRLLTGITAEEIFISQSQEIVGVAPEDLIDKRRAACGYDFAVKNIEHLVFEVKGIATVRGTLLFTEREWQEAGNRGEHYKAVVIGNIDAFVASQNAMLVQVRVVSDPRNNLDAKCTFRQTVTAMWHSPFTF